MANDSQISGIGEFLCTHIVPKNHDIEDTLAVTKSALHVGVCIGLQYPEYAQAVLANANALAKTAAEMLARKLVEAFPIEVKL